MLLKLAWRNIWRNKRRSLIMLTSIVVGVLAMTFNDSLSMGMIQQILRNQISSNVSHMQVHRRGFRDNMLIQNTVPDQQHVAQVLNTTSGIAHFTRRVVTFGLISSATNSAGGIITGIEPVRERNITSIYASIIEGTYLSEGRNTIILGRKLAEKLDVRLGDKVVAMASRMDGSVGAEMFRLVGLFETVSSEFDKAHVFIPLTTAQYMLGLGSDVSEFAISVHDVNKVEQVKRHVASRLDNRFETLSYIDILPMLISQVEMYKESMAIIYIIVGIAMMFGIINTILMSVYERIQEFGVLKSIGMKNSKLLSMIVLEALYLGALGTLVGLALTLLVHWPLFYSGINFSSFAESLTAYGTGAVIYPVFSWETVINTVLLIPFITVAGALMPAIKALRLQPVAAIRYV